MWFPRSLSLPQGWSNCILFVRYHEFSTDQGILRIHGDSCVYFRIRTACSSLDFTFTLRSGFLSRNLRYKYPNMIRKTFRGDWIFIAFLSWEIPKKNTLIMSSLRVKQFYVYLRGCWEHTPLRGYQYPRSGTERKTDTSTAHTLIPEKTGKLELLISVLTNLAAFLKYFPPYFLLYSNIWRKNIFRWNCILKGKGKFLFFIKHLGYTKENGMLHCYNGGYRFRIEEAQVGRFAPFLSVRKDIVTVCHRWTP